MKSMEYGLFGKHEGKEGKVYLTTNGRRIRGPADMPRSIHLCRVDGVRFRYAWTVDHLRVLNCRRPENRFH